MAGKLKTVVQCASIAAVLVVLWLRLPVPSAASMIRDALTWLAVVLTVYSGLAYIKLALPSLRGES